MSQTKWREEYEDQLEFSHILPLEKILIPSLLTVLSIPNYTTKIRKGLLIIVLKVSNINPCEICCISRGMYGSNHP